MALVASKQIELKTGLSIKKFITETRRITDARMINKLTGKEIRIRAKSTDLANKIINQLNLPH